MSSREITTTKTRRLRWTGLICIALLLFYGASPYFFFWRFTVALRSGNTAALAAQVDFPAVRESLKKQLVAFFSAATGAKHKHAAALGPTLIDILVDAYVTPAGLAALIANPKIVRDRDLRPPQAPSAGKGVDWSKVRYAFFTKPRTFVVDLEGTKLQFRFTGLRWQLNKLDLGLNEPKS